MPNARKTPRDARQTLDHGAALYRGNPAPYRPPVPAHLPIRLRVRQIALARRRLVRGDRVPGYRVDLGDEHHGQQDDGVELHQRAERQQDIAQGEMTPLRGPEGGEREQRGQEVEARQHGRRRSNGEIQGIHERATTSGVAEEPQEAKDCERAHPARIRRIVVGDGRQKREAKRENRQRRILDRERVQARGL